MSPSLHSGLVVSFQYCDYWSSSTTATRLSQELSSHSRHELFSTSKKSSVLCTFTDPGGRIHEGQSPSAKARRKLGHSEMCNFLFRNPTTFGNGSFITNREKAVIRRGGAGGVRDSSQSRRLDEREESRQRGQKPRPNAKNVHVSSGYWRIFGVEVPLEKDLGKDHVSLSDSVLEAIAASLKCHVAKLPHSSFSVVRKSLDARKDPRFVYTIDLDVKDFLEKEAEAKIILSRIRTRPGKAEFSPFRRTPLDLIARLQNLNPDTNRSAVDTKFEVRNSGDRATVAKRLELLPSSNISLGLTPKGKKARVVVVGSGPAGLFAALSLAENGLEVVLIERGQPVETRGRDIGALMVRRLLDPNSNLCYGEASDPALYTECLHTRGCVVKCSSKGLRSHIHHLQSHRVVQERGVTGS